MPAIRVQKADQSIHAASQYIPAAKSQYTPDDNSKRMTPQHRASLLLPNLEDQNGANELESVGISLYQQSQYIPPPKSSKFPNQSYILKTQHKPFKNHIMKD